MPIAASRSGWAWMRMAGRCWPTILTSDTPLIWLIERARRLSARSLSSVIDICAETTLSTRIGLSAGLTLRQVGRFGRSLGRRPAAALIAACTSCAAVSMFFSRSNCSVIEVLPSALVEVISMMPGTPVSCVSSGVATADAMVSALAPGRLALTRMVGNSASGRGATGNRGNAATPSSITASVSSVVATGCRTNQLDSETRVLMVRPRPWQPVRRLQ